MTQVIAFDFKVAHTTQTATFYCAPTQSLSEFNSSIRNSILTTFGLDDYELVIAGHDTAEAGPALQLNGHFCHLPICQLWSREIMQTKAFYIRPIYRNTTTSTTSTPYLTDINNAFMYNHRLNADTPIPEPGEIIETEISQVATRLDFGSDSDSDADEMPQLEPIGGMI